MPQWREYDSQAVVDGHVDYPWRVITATLCDEAGGVLCLLRPFDIAAAVDPDDNRNRFLQGARCSRIVDGLWHRNIQHQTVL